MARVAFGKAGSGKFVELLIKATALGRLLSIAALLVVMRPFDLCKTVGHILSIVVISVTVDDHAV